jgi:signal peptidase II
MRALLALRAVGLDGAGVGRDLRALPGRAAAGRPGGMSDAQDSVMDAPQEAAATMPPRRLEWWLPILIVAIDQLTKAMVRAMLPLSESVTVVQGFINITHVRNAGAAFGILNTADFPFKSVVIAVIATAALVGVGVYAASLAHHQLVARIGLALIIGGATGNLIDRILAGSVVDFVDVYYRTYHFWAFNVADSAISVGVAIMIFDMLGLDKLLKK